MSADDALQQLIGATVASVNGTRSPDDDECLDFSIVTDKGALIAYVTNNEAIALQWVPA